MGTFHKYLLSTAFMAALTIASSQAQPTILSTTPAQQGTLPTMAQLTPGNPDYLYAKSLVGAEFDAEGNFHFYLPEDADKASAQQRVKGTPSADGLWTALNEGDRLWVETLATEGDKPQSRHEVSYADAPSDSPVAGQSDVVWGQSVHRNEFGIDGGLFWSPNGHQLAFYCMNQSMVGKYPLLQTDAREAEVKWIRYPMAGMTSHQVVLGIYNPDQQHVCWIQTGAKLGSEVIRSSGSEASPSHNLTTSQPHNLLVSDPEHYLACVSWRPDGKQIFIAELNRKQNYMELNAYDAATGRFVETLFVEESAKYVEPEEPLYFLPGSNDKFVWMSERDGFKHAYLYDLSARNKQDGSLLDPVQLTSGEWLVTSLMGADPKAKNLYFMATKESPLEQNLYSVDLKKLKITRLTTEPGVHRVMINKQYTQIYDTFTNHDTPRQCQLIILKNGKPLKTDVLYTAPNPFEGLARPEVEVGTLKAADGVTDLYYRLVKPNVVNEDLGVRSEELYAGRKFPVVVYLYNGPHAQMITEGFQWGLPGWDCYMANKGYVVFTIDGRGSENRGLAFEQTIWHNLGYHEGLDQMKGVEYLKSLPFVDPDRIGIYGWSYGGFMTTYMMLNYPETFKVGVCGGPVLDWSRYEVMYGERYMGTPDDNPEGYAANTMINQTEKLRGHLLIIHDDQDGTVVPQMSYQFLKNAVANGTYPDFLMYMNHEHNVRGKDRVHLLNNIARYFDEHL